MGMLDDELLRRESKEGFQLGYTGKQVIHPRQIPIVQESFAPDPAILQWAKRVVTTSSFSTTIIPHLTFHLHGTWYEQVEADANHAAAGTGAFTLDGTK
jgi:hypothetical protein